ncbi:hypothetical protein DPSP01_005177 [Paraphaeosphaeria sporulosa]
MQQCVKAAVGHSPVQRRIHALMGLNERRLSTCRLSVKIRNFGITAADIFETQADLTQHIAEICVRSDRHKLIGPQQHFSLPIKLVHSLYLEVELSWLFQCSQLTSRVLDVASTRLALHVAEWVVAVSPLQ